jgi:hypothetical protein
LTKTVGPEEMIAHDQAEADEALESQEMREALLNGLTESEARIVKMIDNRFTRQARRIRVSEAEQRSQGREIERLANAQTNMTAVMGTMVASVDALRPVADDIRIIRRIAFWLAGIAAATTALATATGAVLAVLWRLGII